MSRLIHLLASLLLFFSFTLLSCGEGEEQWVEEHGYGPISEPLVFNGIDDDLAVEGKQIFDSYCAACHAMNASISGPALGRITERRTPEFVINYTLNPRENRQQHPIGQELADNYPGGMANTGIDEDQARAVLEYLRYYSEYREDPSD